MDVEQLREALDEYDEFYEDEPLENQMTWEPVFAQAARDHLACGTVTDEMVEAAFNERVGRMRRAFAEAITDDMDEFSAFEYALAAFRVETGEQE